MKKRFSFFLILFIFLVGFWVRIYRLNLNSPSLYADETVSYPFLVNQICPANSFLDYFCKNLFLRLTRFTWFLGLTPLGIRLPSAVFGTFLLFIIYRLAKEINFEKKTAVSFVTLILAVFLPWGIHLSRTGYVFLILSLISVGAHWLIYLKARTSKIYFFSLLPLLLAAYFYPSIILIGPLVLLLVLFKIWQLNPSIKVKKIMLVAGSLLIIFFGWLFFKISGYSRAFDLAIWRDVNVSANENVDRGLARLSGPTIFSLNHDPEIVSRIFYNRPLAVIRSFVRTYLSFYSPDFLFLKGDPILRHSTGRFGVFYPFLLPFLIYGIFLFFTKAERKTKEMFLFWLLVTPIPAALTKDGSGYLLRVVSILPLLTYLSALGLMNFFDIFERKLKIIMIALLSLVFFFSAYSFLFNYFHVYSAKSARSFEYGFKELSDWQKEENFLSLLVIWDDYYPRSYFGFWQSDYFKDFDKYIVKKIPVNQSNFYQGGENLYFSLPRTENDLQIFLKEKIIIYIALPADLKENFNNYKLFQQKPKDIIYYPDQTPAIYLYQNF